jgi:hypothetical protein
LYHLVLCEQVSHPHQQAYLKVTDSQSVSSQYVSQSGMTVYAPFAASEGIVEVVVQREWHNSSRQVVHNNNSDDDFQQVCAVTYEQYFTSLLVMIRFAFIILVCLCLVDSFLIRKPSIGWGYLFQASPSSFSLSPNGRSGLLSTNLGDWEVKLQSPCKINLFLRILARRPNGYRK